MSSLHECISPPLDAEDFREKAHTMVDFIADYYRDIEKFPVQSQVAPGYLKKLLPSNAPVSPECLANIIADVRDKIIPGVTHWMSPSFFGYFPASGSTAGYLGDMLSDGFNIVGFSWLASPAAAELEVISLDWLAKLLNLPQCFLSGGLGGGTIQGTASEAMLLALLAARSRAMVENGLQDFSKLAVYCSDQMHSCLLKACVVAGIPSSNVLILPADKSTNYALSPNVLMTAVRSGISSGLIPCFLAATIGTTSSAAVDPLDELGDIAMEYGMWYHIDAAYGGNACICPEHQHYLDGVEKADSFNMNLHKWLLTNFSCSAIWFKDTKHLIGTLSTKPEYLTTKAASQGVVDFKDWEIPLGRRFRSLKLWFVMRLHGSSGLQAFVRKHIDLAEHFERLLLQDTRFQLFCPRKFALVCFRLKPAMEDEEGACALNIKLLEALNDRGKIFLTHTVLSGVYVLRLNIGSTLTELTHVNGAWESIQHEAYMVLQSCER